MKNIILSCFTFALSIWLLTSNGCRAEEPKTNRPAPLLSAKPASRTLSVHIFDNQGRVLWFSTNCIRAYQHTPSCTLISFIENGATNEFHAWRTQVMVETNSP